MEDFFQQDLGSNLLMISVLIGSLGLFFVFLRILTLLIKKTLEIVFKSTNK